MSLRSSLVSRISVAAVLMAAVAPSRAAAPPVWTADLIHSRAEFRVTHLLLSKVWGHVPFVAMTVRAGRNGMPFEGVDAVLNVAHEDTDNQIRDQDLRSPAYLDVAAYPTIAFTSTKIEPGPKPDSFRIDGELTIHGVTRPVVLDAHFEGKVPEGTGGGVRVGYTATTTIDRRDYGLTSALMSPANIPLVGNDVEIALTVEAVAEPG